MKYVICDMATDEEIEFIDFEFEGERDAYEDNHPEHYLVELEQLSIFEDDEDDFLDSFDEEDEEEEW